MGMDEIRSWSSEWGRGGEERGTHMDPYSTWRLVDVDHIYLEWISRQLRPSLAQKNSVRKT